MGVIPKSKILGIIMKKNFFTIQFGEIWKGWLVPSKTSSKSWSWQMLAAALRDWNYHWIMSSPEKVLLPNETWSETRFWELFPTRHFHLRCWLYFKSSLDIEHEFVQMCKIWYIFSSSENSALNVFAFCFETDRFKLYFFGSCGLFWFWHFDIFICPYFDIFICPQNKVSRFQNVSVFKLSTNVTFPSLVSEKCTCLDWNGKLKRCTPSLRQTNWIWNFTIGSSRQKGEAAIYAMIWN